MTIPVRRPCIDCLRGYFLWNSFIMVELVKALLLLPQSAITDILARHFQHSEWNGFHYVDVGFPGYMILLGASTSFSYDRHQQAGGTKKPYFLKILKRAFLLWVFAFFFKGGFSLPFSQLIFTGIFVKLAYAILVTGVLVVFVPPRWYVGLLLAFLLLYSALLTMVDVPGYGYGVFSQTGNVEEYWRSNVVNYLSVHWGVAGNFAEQAWWYLNIPKITGSCIIGVILGCLLRSKTSLQQQFFIITGIGAAAMSLAWVWDGWVPINKNLWTPSYTLFSGGLAFLMLAPFIQIVEVWKVKKVAFPFMAFGRNSLLAWVCFYALPFDDMAKRLFGVGFPFPLGPYRELVLALMPAILCWLIINKISTVKPYAPSGKNVHT